MSSTDNFSLQKLKESLQSTMPAGRYGEAVDLLQRALPLAWQFGEGDERLAWTSYMLGVCLFRQLRFAEAKQHLQRAAAIYKTVPGRDKWTGKALAWFCHAERSSQSPVTKYELHAKRALDLIGEPSGEPSQKEDRYHVSQLLETLGDHYALTGQHDASVACFDRLLNLSEQTALDEALLGRLFSHVIAGRWNAPQYKSLVGKLHARMPAKQSIAVPATRSEVIEEKLHNIEVVDRFRWLEVDSEERQIWAIKQNDYAQSVLDAGQYKGLFLAESRRLFFVQRYSNPHKRGSRIFYGMAQPRDRQEVIYAVNRLGHFPRTVLDPGKEEITITGSFASRDGEWLAYSTSSNGSDWQTWRLRNVGTGKDLGDELTNVRARYLCWRTNNRDFLYAGYTRRNSDNIPIICNHALRTSQLEDEIVFEGRPGQYIQPFEHGKHLFVSTHTSGVYGNEILHAAKEPGSGRVFQSLFAGREGNYKINGWQGWRLLLVTDHQAPRRKLISIDANSGERFVEIAETEDVLENVFPVSDGFIAHYIADCSSKLIHINAQGRRQIQLDHAPATVGSITWLAKDDLCYSVEGLALPRTIYRLDVQNGVSKPVFQEADYLDPDQYTVRQVFLTGKDGTRINMFLGHKKGVIPGNDTPVWLTGYGGFRYVNSPRYMYDRLIWMDLGGTVAFATIRGGSEYGEEWHRAGCRQFKQNAFDDFLACAEWLIDHGMTSTNRLAISGSSNGGLLMAAALTQRPELFGAACLGSPLTDMLRYHKFNFAHEWVSEYGSSENEQDCQVLAGYSPLHNIRPAVYPATLIQVGAADDRVDPLHSYKFAAALQSVQQGPAPILLKTYEKQGHTYSCAPTWSGVDQLSFLAHAVKLTDFLRD
jgi:prolyl oligopeptidase